MATTHNKHVGSKTCEWCQQIDIRDHIANNTLQQCYEYYLARESIEDTHFSPVIAKFYDMIHNLAKVLGVSSTRNNGYTGRGIKKKECWFQDNADDDIDQNVFVYKNYKLKGPLNVEKLNTLFKTAIIDF